MKEETLLELVERLEHLRADLDDTTSNPGRFIPALVWNWPRLRDSIQEMHNWLWELREQRDDLAVDVTRLLARLDKDENR